MQTESKDKAVPLISTINIIKIFVKENTAVAMGIEYILPN